MNVVDASEIRSIRYRALSLIDRDIQNLLGSLPADKQFSISLTGGPGTGKSHFGMRLAGEFAVHGPVLYVLTEEYIGSPAVIERINYWEIGQARVRFVETHSLDDLTAVIRELRPRFVIVDSINEFLDAQDEQILSGRIVRTLRRDFPEVNGFVFMVQWDPYLKGTRGSKDVEHLVDVPLRTRGSEQDPKFVRRQKARFGGSVTEIAVFKRRR